MSAIKLMNWEYLSDTQLVVKIEVPKHSGSTAASVLKHLYLDNQSTWKKTEEHGSTVDLKAYSTVEYTATTYQIEKITITLGSSTYGTADYERGDFFVLTVEIDLTLLDTSIILSTECNQYLKAIPLYDMLSLRLSMLPMLDYIVAPCRCDIPKEFVDKILLIDAIHVSAECAQIYQAILLWLLVNEDSSVKISKSCGCNG